MCELTVIVVAQLVTANAAIVTAAAANPGSGCIGTPPSVTSSVRTVQSGTVPHASPWRSAYPLGLRKPCRGKSRASPPTNSANLGRQTTREVLRLVGLRIFPTCSEYPGGHTVNRREASVIPP